MVCKTTTAPVEQENSSKYQIRNVGQRVSLCTEFLNHFKKLINSPEDMSFEPTKTGSERIDWFVSRSMFRYSQHSSELICKTCSYKLETAFEFRQHLLKMSSLWEKLLSKEIEGASKALDDKKSQEAVLLQPKLEVFLLDDNTLDDTNFQEAALLQPKLEVVLLDNNTECSEFETIEEYLDDEFANEPLDASESDEDDKFIQNVQSFIKSIKPTQSNGAVTKSIAKPLSTKQTTSNAERLNFRSTSSPHSSQKLKKDKKWWRWMHDCNYCDAKDFITIVELNRHLRLEHPERIKVSCDICKRDYSKLIYLRKHMKYVHQTKQHKCDQCDKSFYYNYNLKSHMLTHTNEKSVICHLCGIFYTPAGLHAHLRTGVHAGQSNISKKKYPSSKIMRYYCHICVPVQRFSLCSELTEHRRLLHKDFECEICKGWFSCMESLENHLKTHSNKERKHCCKICDKTFVRASHLVGHMRREHSENPKPIACDVCEYRCVEPYELTGHKKHAHSKLRPFKCLHCVKTFTHSQAYKDHILTSHKIGEYRYSCSYCSKRFTNSARLIHHRGVHHNGAGN